MYEKTIKEELNSSLNLLQKTISDDFFLKSVSQAAIIIANAFKFGKKVLSCGNGGSHCDAMHFSEELTGRYRKNRVGFPAIAISDSSYISCIANDLGYEYVFSRYISSIGQNGDVLLVISTSGNSENILKAINTANKKNLKVVALTGNKGGKVRGKVDVEICVPYCGYSDRIQEIHIKIIHILVFLVEKEMKNYKKICK